MNHQKLPAAWSDLLHGMAEEALTAEQERQLADLLRTNVEFRREFVRFCQLLTLLTWQSAAPAAPVQRPLGAPTSVVKQRSRRAWSTKHLLAIATIAAVVVCGLAWVQWYQPGRTYLGTVTDVVGRVGLTRGNENQIWLSSEEYAPALWRLRPGDGIETDRSSSATLVLADQTQIRMHPETKLELTAGQGVTATLSLGRIAAKVKRQRPGRALTFVTPQSEVRVLGTELEVLATPARTEVAVSEGRVKVTRPADGSSAEVGTSQFVAVQETGRLAVVNFPQPADDWSEDFERGLPSGWTGQFVHDDLHRSSRGAATAVPVSYPGGIAREVGSPTQESGLFAWHPDSVLHLTFRVQPPEWFHVYLFARSYGSPQPVLTYCAVKPDLWQSSPGEWRTVSIPLSEFHSVTYGIAESRLGRIPMRIAFSGQGGPAGVVIDKVSVDRSHATSEDSRLHKQ